MALIPPQRDSQVGSLSAIEQPDAVDVGSIVIRPTAPGKEADSRMNRQDLMAFAKREPIGHASPRQLGSGASSCTRCLREEQSKKRTFRHAASQICARPRSGSTRPS